MTTRNKASRAGVDGLRDDLRVCKEQNRIEREEERKIRDDIATQLKKAIEENNDLRRRNQDLLDENMMLMKKYIMKDTHPRVRSKRK